MAMKVTGRQLEVTMPKGTTYIPSLFLELIERFMERFPLTFPILRQLTRILENSSFSFISVNN